MPNIEPLTCGACGSDWFRLATFRKSSLALFLPVCLCGTIAPEPARRVLPFGTVIGSSLGQAMAAVESLPDAAAGAILAHRIGRLEHSCLLIQRRLFPRLRIRPRPRLPVRRAATHGLDAIALDLQRTGLLNFRQARKVVRGVIDAWKAALATGESVRTPAGVLLVRTLRSGRRIALRPAAQLRLATETERTRQIASMPLIQNAESPLQCSRCGSQWFAEHEYMYVPMYDPYVVFARPRPGFFVGGAIRFGGGFRWISGYNRFDWRRHEVFVNRRIWAPSVRTYAPPRTGPEQRRFEDNRPNFAGGNREWNRNYTAPAVQPPTQRSFTSEQSRREFGPRYEQRNFAPAQQQPQQRGFATAQSPRDLSRQTQRSFTVPRQIEQRSFAPQPHNEGGFGRGGEGRGHGR
jgi:hypothetical protein